MDDKFFNQLQPAVRRAQQALDEAAQRVPAALVDAVLAGQATGTASPVADAEAALREEEAEVAQARQARVLLAEEAQRAEIAARIWFRLSSRMEGSMPGGFRAVSGEPRRPAAGRATGRRASPT